MWLVIISQIFPDAEEIWLLVENRHLKLRWTVFKNCIIILVWLVTGEATVEK